jgi:hypothetical protein
VKSLSSFIFFLFSFIEIRPSYLVPSTVIIGLKSKIILPEGRPSSVNISLSSSETLSAKSSIKNIKENVEKSLSKSSIYTI